MKDARIGEKAVSTSFTRKLPSDSAAALQV
ncbi:MAG: hypothetical protein ACI9X0_002866 [Kiritimatiellia bacterium]|jgi:hypothetical protein